MCKVANSVKGGEIVSPKIVRIAIMRFSKKKWHFCLLLSMLEKDKHKKGTNKLQMKFQNAQKIMFWGGWEKDRFGQTGFFLFLKWVSERLFTICHAQKLCSAENAIVIVFSAKHSNCRNMVVSYEKSRKHGKNGGLRFNMQR